MRHYLILLVRLHRVAKIYKRLNTQFQQDRSKETQKLRKEAHDRLLMLVGKLDRKSYYDSKMSEIIIESGGLKQTIFVSPPEHEDDSAKQLIDIKKLSQETFYLYDNYYPDVARGLFKKANPDND